jgi:hypothetical protein
MTIKQLLILLNVRIGSNYEFNIRRRFQKGLKLRVEVFFSKDTKFEKLSRTKKLEASFRVESFDSSEIL